MAVGDAYVFPGFLTPVLTQISFPKPPTTFLTCFCRGERRKYAGKKSRLNRGSNSQPPGHESDTFTTEPPGRVCDKKNLTFVDSCDNILLFNTHPENVIKLAKDSLNNIFQDLFNKILSQQLPMT